MAEIVPRPTTGFEVATVNYDWPCLCERRRGGHRSAGHESPACNPSASAAPVPAVAHACRQHLTSSHLTPSHTLRGPFQHLNTGSLRLRPLRLVSGTIPGAMGLRLKHPCTRSLGGAWRAAICFCTFSFCTFGRGCTQCTTQQQRLHAGAASQGGCNFNNCAAAGVWLVGWVAGLLGRWVPAKLALKTCHVRGHLGALHWPHLTLQLSPHRNRISADVRHTTWSTGHGTEGHWQ